ncbi:phospholipid scramblase 2 isoform X1 [Astyanax mexicanus]|uniref:phospholipid scramblase 2 isoform X1 n=1 Tax=Astyanax mexicanus TaxID=7994 RepID=UPI000440F3C7|nr:phospholipid scramblase 2 isoform X1 [Astyanax mexicanus]
MTPVYTTGLPSDSVYPPPVYGQQYGLPPGYVTTQVPAAMPPPPPGYVPPQAPVMMPAPQCPPGCPPGLEYLTQIDQILIHQKVELMEAMLGWETNNQYVVKNSLGQQVFLAAEENDFCTRTMCGPMRSFVLHLQDNTGREVLTLTRPLNCSSCCFPCCLQELEVQSPPGQPIGYVIQKWHPYLPKFTIKDERKQSVMQIVGPFCDCNCCSDVNFEVMSLDGASVIGRISKQWTGMEAEMLTDADNFGVQFPMDLDVKIKAVILSACFLIDFMYFENSPKQDSHHY